MSVQLGLSKAWHGSPQQQKEQRKAVEIEPRSCLNDCLTFPWSPSSPRSNEERQCDRQERGWDSQTLHCRRSPKFSFLIQLSLQIQCIQKEPEAHKLKFQAHQFEEVNRNKLENKLEHTQNCINMKMAKKHQLKKEVDKLHMDRVQFQQLHRNLDKEQDTKAQTLEYQTRANQVTESLDQIYTGETRRC
ncbi:outer dynein arm protein 1-like [Tachysurus ichikawai]